MNPRFRRLLIPGLLVALLVVVLVAAISGRADSASTEPPVESTLVSRIDDSRIGESSGLAVSAKHRDLAYTINDSGNAAVVYAVRISTGEVVGETRVQATWLDTEAMALSRGRLWVADTGDNFSSRTDAALYALDEPGPDDHTAVPRRYPVSYDDGPQNVEAMAAHPDTGRILLLSRSTPAGVVYRLPTSLRENSTNMASATEWATLTLTTDAAYSTDGRRVIVRNYPVAEVRDAESWELIRTDVLPDQQQGETIAIEPHGRTYLIGSEGLRSSLLRIAFDPDATGASPTPSVAASPPGASPDDRSVRVLLLVVGLVIAAGVIAAVVVIVTRRPRASSGNP